MQHKRNGLISARRREKLLELLYTISENKKKKEKDASSMLKPNTKSLLPDRLGKRIISPARIIFAACIMEAYEGIERWNWAKSQFMAFAEPFKRKKKEWFKVLLKNLC